MDYEFNHLLVVFFIGLFGIIFAGMSQKAFESLKGSCKSSFIRNGWTAIQALSVCFIVATISFIMCIFGEGSDCYNILKPKEQVGGSNPYIIISGLLAGSIMGIGIGLIIEYQKLEKAEKEPCDNDDDYNKKMAIGITVLSAIVFTGCIGHLSWVWYTTYLKADIEKLKKENTVTPWSFGNSFEQSE